MHTLAATTDSIKYTRNVQTGGLVRRGQQRIALAPDQLCVQTRACKIVNLAAERKQTHAQFILDFCKFRHKQKHPIWALTRPTRLKREYDIAPHASGLQTGVVIVGPHCVVICSLRRHKLSSLFAPCVIVVVTSCECVVSVRRHNLTLRRQHSVVF